MIPEILLATIAKTSRPEKELESLQHIINNEDSFTYRATFGRPNTECVILQVRRKYRPIKLDLVVEVRTALPGLRIPAYTYLYLGEFLVKQEGEFFPNGEDGPGLSRWLAYEIEHVEGMDLGRYMGSPAFDPELMPKIAQGLGRYLAKRGAGLLHPQEEGDTILTRSRDRLIHRLADPQLAEFREDMTSILENWDTVFGRLPLEWTNCDLQSANIMVTTCGEMTGVVDWEWVERQPLVFDLDVLHELRRRWDPEKKVYVELPNWDEFARCFWIGWSESLGLELTEQLLQDVEVCMRIRVYLAHPEAGAEEVHPFSLLKSEVSYRIPRFILHHPSTPRFDDEAGK